MHDHIDMIAHDTAFGKPDGGPGRYNVNNYVNISELGNITIPNMPTVMI